MARKRGTTKDMMIAPSSPTVEFVLQQRIHCTQSPPCGHCWYCQQHDDGPTYVSLKLKLPCPECGAESGEKCRWRGGYFEMFVHKERLPP